MKKLFLLLIVLLALQAHAQTGVEAGVRLIAQDSALLKQAGISLALSDGRIVAGTAHGLSELRRTGTLATLHPLPVPKISGCSYSGLVEHQGYLYASCATQWGKYNAQFVLIGAPIVRDLSQIRFTVILQAKGILAPSALAFDGKRSFYLADSGMLSGKILQIRLAEPLRCDPPQAVYTSLYRPAGLRYDPRTHSLYFTENSIAAGAGIKFAAHLKQATLADNGAFSGVRRLYSHQGYFGQIALVQGGIVISDPVARKLFHLDESLLTPRILAEDIEATSVAFACSRCKELIVTDATLNALYQLTPVQPLVPR